MEPSCTIDNPGVIARPPRILLVFLLTGIALDFAMPYPFIPEVLRFSAGPMLIVLGVAVMTLAVRKFTASGTNVPTCDPAKTIVTGGIYRYTRNPMYLSGLMMFAGIGITADNPWILALLIPFAAILRYGVIAREERYLENKFGETYRRYKAVTRRWIGVKKVYPGLSTENMLHG
jgi:protein-S-isoprenylcysteine O-methyltransferase Ste14